MPDSNRELEILEKIWAKADKKFRAHVDTCPKLQAMEYCQDCNDIAQNTGKFGLLYGIQEQIRIQQTPSIQNSYTDDQLVEAAFEEWSNDRSRPAIDKGMVSDTYHDSVDILMYGDGEWHGTVKVEHDLINIRGKHQD